jgi:hypothetical protein
MANNIFVYDSDEKPKPFYKSCFGMTIISIIGFFVLMVLVGKSIDAENKKEETNNEYVSSPEKYFGWSYSQRSDPMDGKITKYAEALSMTSIDFEFPHKKSDFYLTLRKKGNVTEIYLTCTDCHFITGYGSDKLYRIKCDSGQPFKVYATGSSSGGVDVVFLGSEKKILNVIENCNTLTIEAEFYDHGTSVLHFDISNLKF